MLRCQTAFRALSRFTLLFSLCGSLCLPAPRPAQAQSEQLTAFNLDQHVLAPTPTIRISASIVPLTGSGIFAVQTATITVDGTAYPATVTDNLNFYITWDASQATNPSEHSVSATAQVQHLYSDGLTGPIITISSTAALPPPNGPYPDKTFYGNGRAADFIIGTFMVNNFRWLPSIGSSSLIVLQQDATTAVPLPHFTWNAIQSNSDYNALTSNPAAYVQASTLRFFVKLYTPPSNAVVMGFRLKLTATPNTTNPSTNAADPALILYDNTAGANPETFTLDTSSRFWRSAAVPLYPFVAKYALSLTNLQLFVYFKTAQQWSNAQPTGSSYQGNNTLYAVLATPTAPMAQPWTRVLDYACDWAKRTSDAVNASKQVTYGFASHSIYNPDTGPSFTEPDITGGVEDFDLKDFLNGSPLTGQCNDFADFLDCLSNSLGAVQLRSQRQNNSFTTNPIIYAGTPLPAQGQPRSFVYHMWTSDGTTATTNAHIYDSAISFNGATPANMNGPLAGTNYYNGLVATPPTQGWTADLWNPFIPTIVNQLRPK